MTATPRRRLAVLLALAAVPWTVIRVGDAVSLVFPVGFLYLGDPVSFVALPTLLARGGGLPRAPELLPLSVLLYVAALTSAATAALGDWLDGDRLPWPALRTDHPRLTGGLLALAGLTHLGVAWSVLHRPAYTPVPVGALGLLAAAWWLYWPAVR